MEVRYVVDVTKNIGVGNCMRRQTSAASITETFSGQAYSEKFSSDPLPLLPLDQRRAALIEHMRMQFRATSCPGPAAGRFRHRRGVPPEDARARRGGGNPVPATARRCFLLSVDHIVSLAMDAKSKMQQLCPQGVCEYVRLGRACVR